MLFLRPPADDAGDGSQRYVPVGEQTAIHFERALLAPDRAVRLHELKQALASDRDIAGWALRAAELRLGRTVNQIDEAAEWLGASLEKEVSARLVSDQSRGPLTDVEWRLQALVTRFGEYERKLGDFEQRLEHEKLESLKELAYGASHEINNPLANIAARAQTLLEDETDSERGRKLSAIHRQAMRAHEMIADLMLFARPPKLNLTRLDVNQLTRRVVAELGGLAQEYGVELACESRDDAIEVLGDETQLGVAIQAVIKNAIEAVGTDGHVWVAVQQNQAGAERMAEIAIRDDGPGISEEVRPHIFDPFFSGREAGRGLGFGLSKCWRIVTDHGGRVTVNRPSTGGTEIAIFLKVAGDICCHC
jgi:signal transduction histidine kinase